MVTKHKVRKSSSNGKNKKRQTSRSEKYKWYPDIEGLRCKSCPSQYCRWKTYDKDHGFAVCQHGTVWKKEFLGIPEEEYDGRNH